MQMQFTLMTFGLTKELVRKTMSVQDAFRMAADGRLMRPTLFANGVIPVKEIYERVCADGYTGFFAIEYIRPKEDCCSLREHGDHLKRYLDYLMK